MMRSYYFVADFHCRGHSTLIRTELHVTNAMHFNLNIYIIISTECICLLVHNDVCLPWFMHPIWTFQLDQKPENSIRQIDAYALAVGRGNMKIACGCIGGHSQHTKSQRIYATVARANIDTAWWTKPKVIRVVLCQASRVWINGLPAFFRYADNWNRVELIYNLLNRFFALFTCLTICI